MIKIAYSDRYVLDLPDEHRFPMLKYELIKEQLLYEGVATQANFYEPQLVSDEVIALTHDLNYWHSVVERRITDREMRKIGFPYSDKLVNRSRSSSGGTLESSFHALQNGISFNVAGGTHHAYSNRGEAFCVLNDLGITANYLLVNKNIKRVAILDLDVHQGNGTAEIFKSKNSVLTISVHGESNYPHVKEKSDLDIALKKGTNDTECLKAVELALGRVDDFSPDIILYQAGVDILSTDKLGTLSVSKQGCKERDIMVFDYALSHQIPIITVMGGGYSHRLADIVDAHCNTFKVAFDLYA